MSDTTSDRSSVPVLAALAAATLTASMGISIASVLLPALTRGFSATITGVQWVVLAYLLAVTVTIVSAGRLGDLFGHRRSTLRLLHQLDAGAAARRGVDDNEGCCAPRHMPPVWV